MGETTFKIIKELATQFRNALEQLEPNEYPNSSWFAVYPRGCCGDTSDLLAKYLSCKGIKAEYVWGMNDEMSHGWLEYEGYIIDITVDQFDNVHEKILITKDKTWHSRFKGQRRSFNEFTEFNDYNAARLGTIYNNVLKKLDNSS